jgi:hypothetical protein
MSRLGRRIVQWEQLAGLMNIPRADIDELRYSLIYHDNRARAEKILSIFNNMEGFSRKKLAGCLEEIQELDLVEPVITGKWRNFYHVHWSVTIYDWIVHASFWIQWAHFEARIFLMRC